MLLVRIVTSEKDGDMGTGGHVNEGIMKVMGSVESLIMLISGW
jgi:hypothetical protein